MERYYNKRWDEKGENRSKERRKKKFKSENTRNVDDENTEANEVEVKRRGNETKRVGEGVEGGRERAREGRPCS